MNAPLVTSDGKKGFALADRFTGRTLGSFRETLDV